MTLVVPEPPLIQSPEALVQLAVEKLQETYPLWNPNPADPEYQMFLAFALIASQVLLLSIEVPEDIIRFTGEVVYQTPPTPATAATAQSEWTAIDTDGHTIAAGTILIVEPEGAEPIAYETVSEAVIPTGSSTVGTTVEIQAVEQGEESNVTGSYKVLPQELLSWVKEVKLTGPPSGGVDEETTAEYTKRILELATLVKPEPILPEDFATFARLMIPALKNGRCLALDMYELEKTYGAGNTKIESTERERCVTVIPILENGEEPSTAVQKETWELLEAHREASFKVFVGSPTYTTISVSCTGTYLPIADKEGTESAVKAALEEFLSSEKWGAGRQAGAWEQRKVVRYQDVVTVVNNAVGFGHYTALTVNGGTADISLSGVAPLTKPGTITVSLSESTE